MSNNVNEYVNVSLNRKLTKKEIFLTDTKTLFDAIRNMGLCMIFIFIAYFGFTGDSATMYGLRYFSYTIGLLLIVLNIIWTYKSSIEKGIATLTVFGLIIIFALQGYGLFMLKELVL